MKSARKAVELRADGDLDMAQKWVTIYHLSKMVDSMMEQYEVWAGGEIVERLYGSR